MDLVLLFLVAASLTAVFPGAHLIWNMLAQAAKTGFTATLFLIGSGTSRKAVQKIGWRPMAMGVLLWLIVAVVSLCCIDKGWISL